MVLERSLQRRDVPRGGRGTGKAEGDFSTAVFWMLLVAGMAVLGACIVVPVWMNSQKLAWQGSNLSERVDQCRLWASADLEAVEAATSNAAFNERLLIEELNYQRPGEQVLLVDSGRQAVVPEPAVVPVGAGPTWLRAFVERDTRSILLVMSGGLVLFAFVYYPAGGSAAQRKAVAKIPVHYSMGPRFSEPSQTRQSSLYKT